jgi:catalase
MSESPQELGGPERVVKVLDAMERYMNGVPGYRRGHARGIAFRGHFTPTAEVAALTTAELFGGDRIDAVVRLSNGAASPYLPDRASARRGNPLGLSVRFELPSGEHSTWSALNLAAFMPRTPDDFHAMVINTRAALPGGAPHPLRMLAFLAPRIPWVLPGLKATAQLAPPLSFATARFNGFHSYYLVDADDRRRPFRFRWMPVAGIASIDPKDDAVLPPQYVLSEIRQRVARGPVAWKLVFQMAQEGDEIDDLRRLWPESRPQVVAGELVIDRLHEAQELVDGWVFDPTRMPPGIALSGDPMLHFRSEAYWESHRRRTGETKPEIVPE